MIVASTIVPVETFTPFLRRYALMVLKMASPSLWLFQEMAGLANRRFVGDPRPAQVDPGKRTRRNDVVERFLGGGIAQVEPLLQEVNPQHAFQRNRNAAGLARWVIRLNHRAQVFPGQNAVHLFK